MTVVKRIIVSVLFVFAAGCATQSKSDLEESKTAKLNIISECEFKNKFNADAAKSFAYFNYQGKEVLFQPQPEFFYQSKLVNCFYTNKGVLLIGESRNHPSESIAQMSVSTYLYKDRSFQRLKYLNKSWSCITSYDAQTIKNARITIQCKDKKKGNENIGAPFDKVFEVDVL